MDSLILLPRPVFEAFCDNQTMTDALKEWLSARKIEDSKRSEEAVDKLVALFRRDFTIRDGTIFIPLPKIKFLIEVYHHLGKVAAGLPSPAGDDARRRLERETLFPVEIISLGLQHFDLESGRYIGEPSDTARRTGLRLISPTHDYYTVENPVDIFKYVSKITVGGEYKAAIDDLSKYLPQLNLESFVVESSAKMNRSKLYRLWKRLRVKMASDNKREKWASFYGIKPENFDRRTLDKILLRYDLFDGTDYYDVPYLD